LPAVATATMATNQDSAVTMSTTSSQLARVFGVVIRQIADLLMMMQDYHALVPNLPRVLDISAAEVLDLQVVRISAVVKLSCLNFSVFLF
jgi:E3 ubiquitin-protein ligase EDD1